MAVYKLYENKSKKRIREAKYKTPTDKKSNPKKFLKDLAKSESKTMKEYYNFSDDEHIIWDTEVDYYDDDYMNEVKTTEYQDYLDNLDEDEEPEDFESWYDDWSYNQRVSGIDWEMAEEDLDYNILPEIDKQLNNDILLLSGNYGSNYPDFRSSGAGGVMWENGTEGLKDYFFDFDRSVITTQDGILGVVCGDHDGTVSGQLFTLPDDKTELIKALGLEDEDDLDAALTYGEIDARDLNMNINLLKPIKDTISGYSK